MENNLQLKAKKQFEQYVADMNEGAKILDNVAKKIYTMKTDSDVNLFKKLYDKLYKLNKQQAYVFEKRLKEIEPKIEELNDTVQKLTISNFLITELYKYKADNPDIKIIDVIVLIPYYASNNDWLNVMLEHTLHVIANNEVIK